MKTDFLARCGCRLIAATLLLAASSAFAASDTRPQGRFQHKVQQRIEDLSQRGEPVDDESMQLAYEVSTSDRNTERWVAHRELLETSLFNESARDMPFHGAVDEDNQPIIVIVKGDDPDEPDGPFEFESSDTILSASLVIDF